MATPRTSASRRLTALPWHPTDPVAALLPRLEQALQGTGPALLPVPADDAGAARRTAGALRADDPDAPVDDDVAVVVATSGSTGTPKGVELTATALRASAEATYARLGGAGDWLLALSPTHVAGLQVLVRSLVGGSAVAAVPPGFDGAQLVRATARLGARRYVSLVPTQLVRLLAAEPTALEAARSYDAVLLGGAAAPAALLQRARDAGLRVVTTYGMSETSGGCVYDGRPLDGVDVHLGDDGRISLGGPVLARGYRLQPELTAEHFAGGTFRTNDLGTLDADGRLTVLGRADDVIVTGGENVHAGAVEDALAAHPAVREAAAFAVPDAEWGQRVEAAVVAADPRDPPTLEALRDHVGGVLGRAAAPRALHVLDALPLLPSGKVDRGALRKGAAGDLKFTHSHGSPPSA